MLIKQLIEQDQQLIPAATRRGTTSGDLVAKFIEIAKSRNKNSQDTYGVEVEAKRIANQFYKMLIDGIEQELQTQNQPHAQRSTVDIEV